MSVNPGDSRATGVGDDERSGDPDLEDAARRVAQRKGEIRYPIRDYEGLWRALGGDETVIRLGNRDVKLADARGLLPSYYFPMNSEADLIAKLADLAAQGGTPQEILAVWTNAGGGQDAVSPDGWS